MTLFRNPVSYSIYVAFAILALASMGEAPLVVLQHLVVPYTVDITRGVGEAGASVFRALSFLAQFLVALFVLLVVNAKSPKQRVVLSIVGILFVMLYCLIVMIGYVTPRLH